MVTNLITGIGGFVASHLARLLIEKGETVVGTYRWTEDLTRIADIKDKIIMVPADLLDAFSLIRCIEEHKPDYIFHLAAQSYVPDSFINPVITIQTNTIGTVNLLEAIRLVKEFDTKEITIKVVGTDKKSIGRLAGTFDPIIHICSSSEFYGKVEKNEIPITEEHPMRPGNQYAIGKIGADAAGYFYYHYYGLKVIRTRMFTHTGYGRTMMSAECAFAKQIAEFEKNEKKELIKFDLGINYEPKEYILRHGNLNSMRTWADVRDAVEAYWLMMRHCKPGEVYNIGGDTEKTIQEMLDYLISQSPIKDKIVCEMNPSKVRKLDVNLQIVDTSKFKKDCPQWKPKYSFEETMNEVLRWWREQV